MLSSSEDEVRKVLPVKLLSSLEVQLKNKEFYDAHQKIRTWITRLANRNDSSGFHTCLYFGKVFADNGEFDLTTDLAKRGLKMLIDKNEKPNVNTVELLSELFKMCPPGSGRGKYEFMNSLISWTADPIVDKSGWRSLHLTIADSYLQDEEYGNAQKHLVYTDDLDMMICLLVEWSSSGYQSETDLFTLRFILCLLAQNRIEISEELLNTLGIDFDDQNCSSVLQLSYLITQACKHNCYELFELCVKKYALILRRDSGLQVLIHSIEQIVFQTKVMQSGLMSMIGNMFGGGNAVEDE